MATLHIACEPEEIAPRVLMPGDPRRAEHIARDWLQGAKLVSEIRGIGAWTGTLNGTPVSVVASGMGVPSMSIYATELYTQFGVERICRVGTCGAISAKAAVRDVVVAAAAHTNSAVATEAIHGVTLSLAPSFEMLQAAVAAAQGLDVNSHVGPVFTSDFFYAERSDVIPELAKLGTLAIEMEAAGLYRCAFRAGVQALAVLTVSDHLMDASSDLTAEERESSFAAALEVASAAILA